MNQILKRQTSRFHYGSKVPAVTITVFITILEQNRLNSCQSSTKFSEVNVKNTFTSHIDKQIIFDTRGVIIIRKSKKKRTTQCPTEKRQKENNDIHTLLRKLYIDRATRTTLKTGD